MNNKEFLTEENYEKGKKKIKNIALIILIAGVLIGLGLIITGAVLSSKAEGINLDLNNSNNQEAVNKRTEAEIQSDIDNVNSKIDAINLEISNLKTQKQSIFASEGFSEAYSAKETEINQKESELTSLKRELTNYKQELNEVKFNDSGVNQQIDQFENLFNDTSAKTAKAKYIPFYMIGAFIIISSGLISLAIFIFAKRREIMVFTTQQTMPVTQEVIGKMAPTVGNAAGTIGKELAKGIKEGINEANQKEEN